MTHNNTLISSNYARLDNLNIHYLGAGKGDPTVLLHGWPTSSYLWRKIMEPLAEISQVIAPDLPGFGKSDKPINASYSLDYHLKVLDSFFDKLGIRQTDIVVHDLGGPVGLLWAVRNPGKVRRLVILNTVIYPEISIWVKLFMLMAKLPFIKNWLVSPFGISQAMKLGVMNKEVLTGEVISEYQTPFASSEARQVLLKTLTGLSIKQLQEIADKLPGLNVPIRMIYGERDFLLPGIGAEMQRLQKERPDAVITAIPGCGHFLQEDQPERLSRLLKEFLI